MAGFNTRLAGGILSGGAITIAGLIYKVLSLPPALAVFALDKLPDYCRILMVIPASR
jgi:hypothetical protein